MRVWDVQSKKIIGKLLRGENSCKYIAFSLDGTKIVSYAASAPICVWDATNYTLISNFTYGEDEIRCVSLSHDGTKGVMGTRGGLVVMWRIEDDRVLIKLKGHIGVVSSLAFSPDDRLLITCDEYGHVLLWHVDLSKEQDDHPLGLYNVTHPLGAIHWVNTREVIPATGGIQSHPHLHQLIIEGEY